MILLDTDTFTHYMNANPRVVHHFENADEEPAVTIVTRIEVLVGRFASVLKSADEKELLIAQQRLRLGDEGLSEFQIVSFDSDSAETFARLRQMKNLKKIGRADIMIASIALAHDATLVTRNLKHFRQVPGLTIENWAD